MNGSGSKAATGLAKGVPPKGAALGALDDRPYYLDPFRNRFENP
jgi:hypothetical protein